MGISPDAINHLTYRQFNLLNSTAPTAEQAFAEWAKKQQPQG